MKSWFQYFPATLVFPLHYDKWVLSETEWVMLLLVKVLCLRQLVKSYQFRWNASWGWFSEPVCEPVTHTAVLTDVRARPPNDPQKQPSALQEPYVSWRVSRLRHFLFGVSFSSRDLLNVVSGHSVSLTLIGNTKRTVLSVHVFLNSKKYMSELFMIVL